MKKLLLMMLAVVISTASIAKKYDLSLKLNQGDTHKFKTTGLIHILQHLPGMEMKIDMDIEIGINLKVDKVLNDAYKMEVSYDVMKMKVLSPQGEVTMGSEGEGSDEITTKVFKAMTNFNFYVIMDKYGRPQAVEGYDNLGKAITAEFPEMDPDYLDYMIKVFSESFGPKQIKEQMKDAFGYLPTNEVEIGESWTSEVVKENEGFEMIMNNTYTFIGENQNNYLIELTSDVKGGEGIVKEMNGINFDVAITGDAKGAMYIDQKSSWIDKGNMGMTVLIKLNAAKQDITINMDMDVKMEFAGE